MASRFNPKLVGAFVLAATALGTVAAIYLGSARLFQRKVRFAVVFSQDLGGLEVDAPVKFRGVAVGRVASIHLSIGSPREPLRELYMPVVIPPRHRARLAPPLRRAPPGACRAPRRAKDMCGHARPRRTPSG